MMNTQILYIITGLPYAGKTTLTNVLVKRFGFTIASVDEVLEEENYKVEQMTLEDWNHAYSEAFERLRRYLAAGQTVIFDGGSLKTSERQALRDIAEMMKVKCKLIYVNTPKEEINRRWLENQTTKARGHLEAQTMNVAYDMFEEPQADEQPILYNQHMNLDDWVKGVVLAPSSS
jgi:predicted kinase